MGQYSFKLPDVGEGTAEAEIAEWRVKVGDKVEEDQPLVDMMTDKATVELTSPVAGVIRSLAGKAGEMAAVGSVLVVFDTEGGEASSEAPAAAPAPAAKPAVAAKPAAVAQSTPAPKAEPAAAKAAPAPRKEAPAVTPVTNQNHVALPRDGELRETQQRGPDERRDSDW